MAATLLTMAPDPPKSRTRALLKAIGGRFHTILPTSRSSSPRPPALSDANTTNPLHEPPEVAGNQSRESILLNSDPSSLHSPAHTIINPANTVNEAPDVPGTIVQTSRPRGDEPSTSDQPSQHSSSTHPGNNYSDMLVKAGSRAWKGLETALRLLEKSAGAFPPLKSAVGGLVACLDLFEVGYCFRFPIVYHF